MPVSCMAHEFVAHVLDHLTSPQGEISQRAARPIITARAPSREALIMSLPHRMPPLTSTSALPGRAADVTSLIVSR